MKKLFGHIVTGAFFVAVGAGLENKFGLVERAKNYVKKESKDKEADESAPGAQETTEE